MAIDRWRDKDAVHIYNGTLLGHEKEQNCVICCGSATKSCPAVCDPMDCSTPGFPVLCYLLEFAQNHIHWVSDAIQPSHPLSPPFSSCPQSFPASVFSNKLALRIRWPKYWRLSFNISPSNEYSGLIPLGLTGLISLQSKGLSIVFSSTTVWKHQFFSAQLSSWSNSHIHTWLLEKL